MNEEIVYWDTNSEAEYLHYDDMDEAIEYYLEDIDVKVENFPEELEVFGYTRLVPPKDIYCGRPLERMLECLDEEFGSPDEGTDPTPEMIQAEKLFIETVLSKYEVWSCKQTISEVINIREWCEKNRSDWLRFCVE